MSDDLRTRTTQHTIGFANVGKRSEVVAFLAEYRRCLGVIVGYVWENGYTATIKAKEAVPAKDGKPARPAMPERKIEFSVKKNLLQCPTMFTKDVVENSGLKTNLTARALKCCMTQAAGMIGAACEKQRKRIYTLNVAKGLIVPEVKDGDEPKPAKLLSKRQRLLLAKKIKTNIPQIPYCGNAKAELNTICCDFLSTGRINAPKQPGVKSPEFDGFIKLKSIYKVEDNKKKSLTIALPIKETKHSRKMADVPGAVRMASFLIGEEKVCVRWSLPAVPLKKEGVVLAGDQGMKDLLTMSNDTVTKKQDKHKHTLESIIEKVSRAKKGSKGFKRAKDHQKNFVNWSINQINFSGVREFRLEQIWNIGHKNPTSRKLSHWQNTLIRDKIASQCEDMGIRFVLQSSTYRSQRCSDCGNVRKANRKGKRYLCKRCGLEIDSDLNAALNHAVDLPEIPYTLRRLNLNRGGGFLWNPTGIFRLDGTSLQSVPNQGTP